MGRYTATITLGEVLKEEKLQEKPERPEKRWARDWDQCRSCGTTLVAHRSGGLCSFCYNRNLKAKRRAKARAGPAA